MKGDYKVNSPNLIELHKTATKLVKQFDKIELKHVYRIENNYLPIYNFNTKYYTDSSNFVKYLQEEYNKLIIPL